MEEKVKFDFSKLNGRIIEKFGTRTAFADACNISYNSLSKKLNNHTEFNDKDRVKMLNLLDIKNEEIGSYFFTLKV